MRLMIISGIKVSPSRTENQNIIISFFVSSFPRQSQSWNDGGFFFVHKAATSVGRQTINFDCLIDIQHAIIIYLLLDVSFGNSVN